MKPAPLLLLATAFLLVPPTPAWADPPSHAPAHGWRKKHDPDYAGYSGRHWSEDYGIVDGRCNREAIGAVLGGVVGGAVGSQLGEGRRVATMLGAVVGAVVGAKIGRDMDEADRACIAHAIELGGANKRVRWTNERTGAAYLLTPLRDYERNGTVCRDFTLRMSAEGLTETRRSTACRAGEGSWRIVGR